MDLCIAEIKDVAQAFQGFATGLAILAGGVWALYRFSALKEVDRAKAELNKKEQDLKEQPVVDLSISAHQKFISGSTDLFLDINIIAKNNGSQNARLAYEENFSLYVYKVTGADGEQQYECVQRHKVRKASNPNEFAKATGIRSGQTQEIPFYCQIKEPGLYFIAFRVVVPNIAREQLEAVGLPAHRILSHVAKCYVIITSNA